MGIFPFKNDKAKNPFHNDIQSCCKCGDCCLIHQQFTLKHKFNFPQETTVTVYEANGYEPACTPGASNGEAAVQQTGFVLPFGTILAINNGVNAFDVQVIGENFEDAIIHTIHPGTQVGITGVFQRVNAIYPTDPVRAAFQFDLFLFPLIPV
ncbi:hypothetical protein [Cytobacillus dafuensis]|uniref:Uncharacterized protein n=1 Tax=Cytobacillus dafuensis TaxID=1742359 RepID=A0A5B8Z3Y1_CYTDA|nr:hypothetical protein [Cytobacillus dafuensis]QED46319.1 hypothetical protein FSZ17_02915 [Cytobacillus dafuensis]